MTRLELKAVMATAGVALTGAASAQGPGRASAVIARDCDRRGTIC